MLNLKKFQKPSARRTPGYFWCVGCTLDADKMRAELEEMVRKNIRSICLHPIPPNFRIDIPTTMAPEYLSEAYNKIIGQVVDICKDLGMNYYLYDEGGWPSGGACGQVWKSDPEKFTRRYIVSDGSNAWKIIKENVKPELAAPYPNLLEKGVTEKFLELTHEAHVKYCSRHFDATIHMAFTDEPTMPGIFPGRLGYCSDLFEEFRKRKGYALEDHLCNLLNKQNHIEMRGDLAEKMIDYCDVMSQLFTERYLIPLRDWCRKHDLLSAGHFGGEDEWFNFSHNNFGSIMRALKHLDCPGVDMIWHQLYPGERLHVFPKLASSAAHLINRNEVIAEMFAIYGGGLLPYAMKFMLDYMLVCGVNTFVFSGMPHYSDNIDLSGARPVFGKNDPMWEEFSVWHTYAARMSELLTSGKADAETAFYFDMHSLWLGTRESEYTIFNCVETAEMLRRHQRDFDFIDDESILDAKLKNGKLCIGSAAYSQLVIPEKHRMSKAAAEKIELLKKRGFPVLIPDESDQITPTIDVAPPTWKLLVHKRVCKKNGCAGYFIMNTSKTTVKVTLTVKEKDLPVSVADHENAVFHPIDSKNGSWEWEFSPYESRFFFCGNIETVPFPQKPVECVKKLDSWQIKPLKQFFVSEAYQKDCDTAAVPAELGDWGRFLGEDFSGKASYTTSFRCDGKTDIRFLDLGKVCCTCTVKLNGKEVGKHFFGDAVFDVRDKLKKGINHLEIIVSNTLANALHPSEVQKYWQEKREVPSPYNTIQQTFEKEAMPSGLFGPIRLMK